MTALKIVATTGTLDCLDCHGEGCTRNGQRPCIPCAGTGVVDPQWVATCENCTGPFWVGTGCQHQDDLCADCKGPCQDCADEDRATRAEADAVFFGGARHE